MESSDISCSIKEEILDDGNEFKIKKIVKCDCKNCEHYYPEKNIFSRPICINHVFNICKDIKLDEFEKIQFELDIETVTINQKQIIVLKDFYDKIRNILDLFFNKKSLLIDNECEINECKKRKQIFLKELVNDYKNDCLLFKNPILAFKKINSEILLNSRKENLPDPPCHKKCFQNYMDFLNNLFKTLNNTILIKRFLSLQSYEQKNSELNLYNEILNIDLTSKKNCLIDYGDKILCSYDVSPFIVTISASNTSLRNIYSVKSIIFNSDTKSKINILIKELNSDNFKMNYDTFIKINNLLNAQIQYLKNLTKKDDYSHDDAAINYAIFKNSGFFSLFPFLIDSEIEEIFLDKKKDAIYIDHRKYGRCKTNIHLSEEEIESFITRVRIESNLPLDYSHPSLKTEIITDQFQVRVAIIIGPLATDNTVILIRKLRKKYFSILELISNNTISIDVASYLIFQLFHKRNIIVIGAPGSGKTTLINALDMLTPEHWRKIYIEDAIESIDQSNFNIPQVRISTKKATDKSKYTKEMQVRECLHRTPDMVYLGEMILKSSIRAFFFLLKVGLRCGLCTSHGENPELMIKRWMIEDGISITSISDIDLMVQISKVNDINTIKRRVVKVCEVRPNSSNTFEIETLFQRDASTDIIINNNETWETTYEKSPVLKKIRESGIEAMSLDEFKMELNILKDILKSLLGEKDKSNLRSYLKKFWINHKRNK